MLEKFKSNKNLIEWVKSIILAVIFSFFLLKFVVFFAVVPTGSMIPAISEGDRIIVWKVGKYLDPENYGLKYGDLVVFEFIDNTNDKKLLIKRVLGLGGDIIKIENGSVYRNNVKIEESYVKNKDSFFMNEITIPKNEIFVLGDNRPSSFDSRYWSIQTVPLTDVVGEVFFK